MQIIPILSEGHEIEVSVNGIVAGILKIHADDTFSTEYLDGTGTEYGLDLHIGDIGRFVTQKGQELILSAPDDNGIYVQINSTDRITFRVLN